MTIGPCTTDDVQNAMQRFDLEMRDTPEWRQWEDDKNNKFAFVSNGRRYPMKEVISIATGTPKTDFRGGEESIRFANKLRLNVDELRRQALVVLRNVHAPPCRGGASHPC
jgi:hypothetical protein